MKHKIANNFLPLGTPTSTLDVNGNVIRLGDQVGYEADPSKFTVIFKDNAFRKKYKKWDKYSEYPILEYGTHAKKMRLMIIKPTPINQLFSATDLDDFAMFCYRKDGLKTNSIERWLKEKTLLENKAKLLQGRSGPKNK